jgi:hypothetical protein
LRFAVDTKIENKNSYPLSVTVFDVIPQFFDILFNTYSLCILNIDSKIDSLVSDVCSINVEVAKLQSFHYQKSQCNNDVELIHNYDDCFDSISWSYQLPPNSIIVAHYIGLKHFMHMSVFPPDASRGIEIPPAIVYDNMPPYERIITTTQVISLPLSDFSMLFNVITLVSTLLVFIVGTMINTLVKRKIK